MFIGVVIKYMDDLTDGDATKDYFPYYLLLTSCAILLDKNVAIPSLWAAYAIGMADKLKVHYIFNLTGITEGIIVLLAGLFVFGPINFAYYIILMLFVNLTDDLIDFSTDDFGKNFARKYGVIEISIVSVNLLLLLFYLNYQYTFLSLIAYTGIQLYYFYRGRIYDWKDNTGLHRR